MTFVESVTTVFSKFVTWQGRASRSEYWYFLLFSIILYILASSVISLWVMAGGWTGLPNYLLHKKSICRFISLTH